VDEVNGDPISNDDERDGEQKEEKPFVALGMLANLTRAGSTTFPFFVSFDQKFSIVRCFRIS
jgi:hypothetical protein